jgi:hypothetical protein
MVTGFLCDDDYIDEDVAYILGMILMRGTFVDKGIGGTLTIRFPHRLESVSPAPGYELDINRATALELALRKLQDQMQDVLGVRVTVSTPQGQAHVRADFPSNTIAWRDLRMLCGNQLSYEQFILPEVIFQAPRDIQLALLRGIADCSSDPSAKDNAWGVSHRIVLQFQHVNWKLPIQVCALMQTQLDIKVQHILWGHPNVRDPAGGHAWAKEHRMRVFAEEFRPIGFGFEYKQKVFETLADWNEKNPGPRRIACNPKVKKTQKRKPKHPDEKLETLPPELRRHFNSACAVCKALGCKQGHTAQKGFFEDVEDDEE